MAVDPYYSNVSLLLPMEGSNGSLTFTDVSPSPKTVTPYGDAKISTAQSKWGNGSGYFDGTGDYLTIPSVLTVGTGDFCIEGWFYFLSLGAYTRLFTQGTLQTNGSLDIELNNTASGLISAPYPGASASSLGLALNTWLHLALSRQSGLVRLFVNGIQKFSATQAGAITAATFYLGALVGYTNSSNHNLRAYVNDFRITQTVARYTGNFTPPGQLWPLVTIQGVCTVAGQGGAQQVAIHAVSGRYLAATATPDATTGAWSASVHPGDYTISYFAPNCQPICHGPYTVA